MRHLLQWLLACCVAGSGAVFAAPDDAEANAVWRQLRTGLFGERAIAAADADTLVLEAPARAEDAAIVPIAVRSRLDPTAARRVQTVWLIVDGNPSPVAATLHFGPASGRADVETRLRIEQYGFVRAIAELDDGSLHMATRFVKASGGCSAPAGKDPAAAAANLGRMRLKVEDMGGALRRAQLMISHPNTSGLAMDQLTRLYPKPHFVRQVTVRYRGQPVLVAEVDFSISENPSFRFLFRGDGEGELEAVVVDTEDRTFQTRVPVAARADGG
ncbi:quinoprotein dehydrogenase-associated SoxYZ-like carrier [Aromatoleum toluvorans]|uniref:Quinoprotein dehydrogenase-associated SoxYZ-like carrier n=1 Tax=Aromatoleum toluvorans TaxID=92002 RepID=A0ABX1PXA6_9RHOO|nr:quinoprotein dehydrogenase-associated SoxYZ-like carrier [Aromatoleum toluvorans]NMG44089.1 quinoprotein dehydrogenase-associated SoxYZ-like carrier [Aromatoleum toluvorans]